MMSTRASGSRRRAVRLVSATPPAAVRRGARAAAPPASAGAHAVAERTVAGIQRARLLAAAVGALAEVGYEGTTVAHVTARARVSRRTFYELFANREECIAGVLHEAAAQVAGELAEQGVADLPWGERMRRGLWTILCFLDRDAALARVLLVHTQHGSGLVLEERERIARQLAAAVDEGRSSGGRTAGCTQLTAEGIVGAVLTILSARLRHDPRKPLSGLLGELVALTVLPYLGAGAARREQERLAPAPTKPARSTPHNHPAGVADPLAALPMRLTYRTARVLEGVGRHPRASNRQIADYAGIADPGQASKLLARLERLGLLAKDGAHRGKGEANAWSLTALGELVTSGIALRGVAGERERAA